jgi:hypothetical protein
MKKTALITAVTGALIALLSYAAHESGMVGVKTFFKISFAGLGLMILAAVYFLVTFVVEWAKENDFFRRIL